VTVVGNDTKMFLWSDMWLEGGLLCHRLRRLFDVVENRPGSVVDMGSLGWEVGGDAWSSRQRLLAREKEGGE